MQAVQLNSTLTGAATNVWKGTNNTLKAAHACVYTSAGLGIINSPVVVYKERQLTKEDSKYQVQPNIFSPLYLQI